MTKYYLIEAKLGKQWIQVEKLNLHKDALQYVKDNAGERYPFRVIRVVKTIVFSGE